MDKGYLGNVNLKRKNTAIEWDNDKVKEFIKCSQDTKYFAHNYIKIVHVDRGLIPIQLYPYQSKIIQMVSDNRRVTVNTSRQAGKTTTAVVILLHYVLFNSHKTVALLANKGDAAREILDRIKIAYEALPKWMQQGVLEWNKGSVEFENGCKIIAAATSSSAIRGKSISFLYIDETAFVENWDEFFASVFPTISSGETTKILFTSTPNGLNHFYKTCEGAKSDENGYKYLEVPWWEVPGRGEEWKKETFAGLDFDHQKFSQEFCCEFLGSSGTLIDGSKLKELVVKKPINESKDNTIFVYEQPKAQNSYVCIADVSRGKGLDYSAFSIFNVTTMPYKQVCVFKDNQITPVEYSEIIHNFGAHYNNAMVMIEINDIGEQVVDLLHFDYEYDNIVSTESGGRAGKRILSGGFSKSAERGIRTTKTVKAVGCSILKMLIEQDQLIVNDFSTISELSTFSKKGASYEAETGCHDDLVMGLVLFGWLSSQQYFKDMTDINTMAKLRERSEEQIYDELLPFGIHHDGNEPIEEVVLVDRGDNAWLMRD